MRSKKILFLAIFIGFIFSGCATVSPPTISSRKSLSCNEHILYGYPSTTGTILYRKGYVLEHDNNKKVATWVSYHLTDKYLVQNVKRTNDFRPDPDLPKGQRSELIDYDKSGYDRGHLCPAEDTRRDKQTESETFFLSNMTPQIGSFNRGSWKDLEAKVRDWAKQRKNIYIITGPIFKNQNYKTIGPNKVAVSTSFYKIIVSCSSSGKALDAIAFILPNKKNSTIELQRYITTIDEIERETGLDFMHDLDDQIETRLEAKKSAIW